MDYETNRILSQEKLDKMGEELSNCAKSFINQQFRKISNDMDTYEKKYKEALEKAKESLKDGGISQNSIDYIQSIFPELKESEDEKIRREIIDYINRLTASPNNIDKYNTWIAWLEKQGEQKLLFEMKTPEESLGVDSDTYSKIVDECIYGEQTPAWSEEDECYMSECINAIATKDGWSFEEKRKTKHWLKSLKQRVGG